MAGAMTGCNYLLFAGLLLGGPPSVEPAFDRETGFSLTDKDATVAVVCYAPRNVKWDYANIDHELSKKVAYRMFQNKIKVINPDRVRDWLDKNPDWDSAEEIGAAFGVTYVVHIEINDYTLYETNSSELYRGRSDILLNVWQMDGETGEQIFTYNLESVYPRAVPRSTNDTKYSTFKREYVDVLSNDIGKLFYSYYNGDDILNVN
jgi:hypothetical protein